MKSIYVGNLDFGVTEDAVRSLFEQYGSVDRVSVIRDRETGQSRGFAFVEMPDAAAAGHAIAALNNYNFSGRTLTVNEARPRLERPAGGASHQSRSAGAGFRSVRSGGFGGRGREPPGDLEAASGVMAWASPRPSGCFFSSQHLPDCLH